ncbi:unnamed protein product [Arabis nemorensis]|uniref:Uncharacterized protein n=1 Tax=Arabis nemorensis TaxID=586526 RepID=A0A565C647_9BRAS|nr:unnamed protein product [Arabis nemorensis]
MISFFSAQEHNSTTIRRQEEAESNKELQESSYVLLKSPTTAFLPILQGNMDATLFTISKHATSST